MLPSRNRRRSCFSPALVRLLVPPPRSPLLVSRLPRGAGPPLSDRSGSAVAWPRMDAVELFPIVRRPAPGARSPVLVRVPPFGTRPLPHITREDYGEPRFETFAYGFADTFAGDVYGDLHEHGATVLATPISRMFVDVNRRRDDFEERDGEVRSRRGVVRTHTMRDVPLFTRPLAACTTTRSSSAPGTAPPAPPPSPRRFGPSSPAMASRRTRT